MKTYTADVQVRYAETDKMGVAHHSSYLLWFELARTGLLREAGHAYSEMEHNGIMLPVLEYGCEFLKGAEYDDALQIRTQVQKVRSRMITFEYGVCRDGVVIAQGWTRHICVDNKNVPKQLPAEIRDAVSIYLVDSQ